MVKTSPQDFPDESAVLREDIRRSNDQALTIKGFGIATSALLAGFALSDSEVSADNRLALFSGLQLLQIILTLMVGARRRQQAHLIAYQLEFDLIRPYEQRIADLRSINRLSLDRWFALSEGALTVILAIVGLIGTLVSIRGASLPFQIVALAVNALAVGFAAVTALKKRTIGVLIEEARVEWRQLIASQTKLE